jgi:uncharacterized UBP type Zn finger protein
MSEEHNQPVSNTDNTLEPEGKSIGEYVKPEVVNQLMEMGFSKNVSEKACFFNQSNLENAVNWIYEHQQEPDFEEELRIVGEAESQKLTPEEIKEKAKNLQELARKKFVQKQKELEEEQERNRVRMSISFLNLSQGLNESQTRKRRRRNEKIY